MGGFYFVDVFVIEVWFFGFINNLFLKLGRLLFLEVFSFVCRFIVCVELDFYFDYECEKRRMVYGLSNWFLYLVDLFYEYLLGFVYTVVRVLGRWGCEELFYGVNYRSFFRG